MRHLHIINFDTGFIMTTENKSFTPASIKDLWQTPQAIFDHYDKRFNFEFDVAASHDNSFCENYYDESMDSLSDRCSWDGNNWLNPPYSNITPWVMKAIDEMNRGKLTVMLIPADTSVKWFKIAYDNCTECHLISGRISFINAETNKPANGNNKGSVVFIFDPSSPVKKSVHLIDRDTLMGVK